jgi:AICAR transformylase/IMP cyclohydrolase PurH
MSGKDAIVQRSRDNTIDDLARGEPIEAQCCVDNPRMARFPFGTQSIARRGAVSTSLLQPGGSLRDSEVIDAANEHGMAMCLTGMLLFHH